MGPGLERGEREKRDGALPWVRAKSQSASTKIPRMAPSPARRDKSKMAIKHGLQSVDLIFYLY